MDEERRKWNKKKMDKEMKDAKEEFIGLERELLNLMVKFSLRALKTFQAGKKEELNRLQINQIVTHEIECVINDLSSLQFMKLLTKKAEMDFYKGKSEPL
jgi:hypothetical protein